MHNLLPKAVVASSYYYFFFSFGEYLRRIVACGVGLQKKKKKVKKFNSTRHVKVVADLWKSAHLSLSLFCLSKLSVRMSCVKPVIDPAPVDSPGLWPSELQVCMTFPCNTCWRISRGKQQECAFSQKLPQGLMMLKWNTPQFQGHAKSNASFLSMRLIVRMRWFIFLSRF